MNNNNAPLVRKLCNNSWNEPAITVEQACRKVSLLEEIAYCNSHIEKAGIDSLARETWVNASQEAQAELIKLDESLKL